MLLLTLYGIEYLDSEIRHFHFGFHGGNALYLKLNLTIQHRYL